MTSLPIVERELRVASRTRGTYWTRAVMGLAAILLAGFLQLDAFNMPSRVMGQRIFGGLTWVALLYCLLAGRRSTADCLSEEKREGTLGLLFLTDLKGYDIVSGKLVATSLNGFYGLLAVFPVLAIPLLLGGVTSGEFWRVVLVLIVTFLFSLATGILVSALSRDARKALGANLLLLLSLVGIPPGLAGAIAYLLPSHPWLPQLLYSCPVYTLYLSDDRMYASHKWHYWTSIAVVHGMTWLLLAAASAVVPRSWQEKDATTGKTRWRELWRAWTYGAGRKREAYRRRLLESGAYYWLAARARSKPLQVWVLLTLVAVWWVWAWAKYGSVWRGDLLNPMDVTTAVIVNSAIKLWITIEAGRQLAEDRKQGAFELLLSTPLRPSDILRGQWRALARQFLLPLVVVLGVEILFMVAGLNHSGRDAWTRDEQRTLTVSLWVAGTVMLVADVLALGWVAMWTALTARSANHATISALVRILVLPWLLLWVVSAVVSSSLATPGTKPPEWQFYLAWWFCLGIGADLFFGLLGWIQVRHRFRQLAALPFSPAPSRIAGWLGRRG